MTPVNTNGNGGRTLLAYFSRPGSYHHDGGRRDPQVGNTQVLAGLIADRLGCEVYRIGEVDRYSDVYDDTVARNVREQNDDARPAVAGLLPDLTGYDTLLLGSPVRNVRPPMIMLTFLEGVDTAGMTLLPFTTHAMSGLGSVPRVYARAAPQATVGPGLAVPGDQVHSAAPDVDRWLHRTGLITS